MTIKNLWTEYDGKGFSAEHADYAERATADEAGNDIASTYATKAENDAKADKVASATSGNFAGLDANGNLTDSGSKASDFATATALSTHTGNSTIHVTANDKATWTGKQNTVGTKNVTTAVDADTPIATGYSSDTISFNTAGRVATYVSSKVSSDLGITSSAYGGKAATAGSADYATTAGSAGSATNATNATNVNLTGSVKDTSTTNGDTIQVKAGSGTAAEITIVNAKHAASADSADSATTASSASSVEWAGVQNKVSASTTTVGIVQLQDSVGASESSTTTAVTPHAVRDAIDSAVASAYHHAGTKTVAQLVSTLLVPANEGNVYNITDSGTTTSNFIEGDGHPIRVGDNVGICDIGSGVYKFDLLSGFVDLSNYLQKSSTTGLVKNDGSIDTSTYLTKTGDGKDVTSTFTKNASDNSGMVSGSKLSRRWRSRTRLPIATSAALFPIVILQVHRLGAVSRVHCQLLELLRFRRLMPLILMAALELYRMWPPKVLLPIILPVMCGFPILLQKLNALTVIALNTHRPLIPYPPIFRALPVWQRRPRKLAIRILRPKSPLPYLLRAFNIPLATSLPLLLVGRCPRIHWRRRLP